MVPAADRAVGDRQPMACHPSQEGGIAKYNSWLRHVFVFDSNLSKYIDASGDSVRSLLDVGTMFNKCKVVGFRFERLLLLTFD
jgi:hypothetical protein